MPSSLRRDYLIASRLYFVLLVLYQLPALYLFLPEPIGPARHASAPLGEILGPALLTTVLLLAMCIGLGLGIRAGKTWAKIVYALLLAYAVYVFGSALPFFPQRSAWTVTREVFALVMMLGVGFCLFRQQFTRRSAPAEADMAASEHTPSN
ncbi:hypothetical protein KLP40_04275 [Hymenobacter sp. NST-14]|uniref:hypothetical protein n=1 Tax=Hymenobacter piscis TaxID=2839984 RepID=UPI001C03102F|nr:hypothetical protein [Hymenobacter piscis]MBT9392370.1 hypothetical protein [Hymenobacter piscis]